MDTGVSQSWKKVNSWNDGNSIDFFFLVLSLLNRLNENIFTCFNCDMNNPFTCIIDAAYIRCTMHTHTIQFFFPLFMNKTKRKKGREKKHHWTIKYIAPTSTMSYGKMNSKVCWTTSYTKIGFFSFFDKTNATCDIFFFPVSFLHMLWVHVSWVFYFCCFFKFLNCLLALFVHQENFYRKIYLF